MKKKILKAIFSIALIGALSFSGVVTSHTGMNTVEAAKINQSNKTLGTVTGIAYDANEQEITWNKVTGASGYEVTITDAEGYEYKTSTSSLSVDISNIRLGKLVNTGYYSYTNYKYMTDGAYTVSVKAVDFNSYNVVATGVKTSDLANYEYDEYEAINPNADYPDRLFIVYAYPRGTAAIASFNYVSDKLSSVSVTPIPYIVKKEVTSSSVVFTAPDTLKLNVGESVKWEYSNNEAFSSKGDNQVKYISTGDTLTISHNLFLPGETVYVRARVYNEYYELKANETNDNKYSAYTAHILYTVPKAVISSVTTKVASNKIMLGVDLRTGYADGYQFAKKVGSKWVTLDTQTSPSYTDEGLNKNTKYTYRVRCYTYNKVTGKTLWSDWYTVDAVTWGKNLDLRAEAKSNTSVKLTWKAISEAEGYEIYRLETNSRELNLDKGVALEAFSTKTLVKTLKGAKKKTYTDKKLTKGESYTYYVRAYRTINKQKVYIEDSDSVSLATGGITGVTQYVNAKGQTVVAWEKLNGIKGYYVEQFDKVTGEYIRIKTLKASAKSYTFAKINVGSDREQYRIRPYDKNMIYDGYTFTITPTLATVTGVKAVKVENGVQITWKPVAGAEYYTVHRTTNSNYTYNKSTKTYDYDSGDYVYEGVVNTTNYNPELDPYDSPTSMGTYTTSKITGTSVVDTALTYRVSSRDENNQPIKIGLTPTGEPIYQTEEAFYNNIQGPEPGVTYYYFVTAHADRANGGHAISSYSSAGDSKAVKVTYTNKVAKKVSKIKSAVSSKKGQVTVKFAKVNGVNGYAVYRSTKKNGTYTLVGTTTKTSFSDNSATSGKTYYYKVASYVKGETNANIYSAKTAAKKVKVK